MILLWGRSEAPCLPYFLCPSNSPVETDSIPIPLAAVLRSSPPTRRYSCKGVVHLVSVDVGQDVTLQVPDQDSCVTGSSHNELPWGTKDKVSSLPNLVLVWRCRRPG